MCCFCRSNRLPSISSHGPPQPDPLTSPVDLSNSSRIHRETADSLEVIPRIEIRATGEYRIEMLAKRGKKRRVDNSCSLSFTSARRAMFVIIFGRAHWRPSRKWLKADWDFGLPRLEWILVTGISRHIHHNAQPHPPRSGTPTRANRLSLFLIRASAHVGMQQKVRHGLNHPTQKMQ